MALKFSALALGLLLAVSSLAGAEVKELSCTQTGATEYKLSYTLTGDSHKVRIFATSDASGKSGRQIVLKTADTNVTVNAGSTGQRIYFFIKPDHGMEQEVSIRHLPLDGTPNFRDLGGYETTDGHFVRWGLIYRSGVLSNLTAKDFTYLAPLGVRVVCDFRTAQENSVAPEIWVPGADVEHISLPIGSGPNNDTSSQMKALLAGNPSPEQLKKTFAKIYGDFAFSHAPEYAKVFAELKEDKLPLLYHCAGGKDRTGVFSALLLLTLGVPENTVLADYSLTDKYLKDAMSPDAMKKMLSGNTSMANLSPELRQVLMAADPAYLQSTLRAIDAEFGSFDEYRRRELHVSDADVLVLRSRLLMP